MSDLEKLLLPHRWSKRLPPDIILDKHIEIITKLSEETKASIPNELNIPYGPLEKEKFDIFGIDLPDDSPIFVYIHGGYWQVQQLGRCNYHFIAGNLHKNGIKSIFIGYELCPNVTLMKILEEIQISTKKCLEYANKFNSKGLYFCGYSAGAHLLAMLFTSFFDNLNHLDQDLVKGVFLLGGIYDLSRIPETSINLPLNLTKDESIDLSPMKLSVLSGLKIKFLIVTATEDSPEFQKQSKEFATKLKQIGLNTELLIIDNVDHFNLVELLIDKDYELMQKLLKIIKQQ